jgi:N-acetylglucosaminyldiphosphoundecaprenol N-acetyl-beta-D-mannosaminyltransferase
MLIECVDDIGFAKVINDSHLALADGAPVAKSMLYLHSISQDRIAGMDLMEDLMREAEIGGKKIFLYGSTNDVLRLIKKRSSVDFPKLHLESYSPPFRELTSEEKNGVIDKINKFNPDLVFVALGCPKQENWMYDHKGLINACMIGLGGVFPVYAGIMSRSPELMQKYGLEWLYRFAREPKRLWKRYLYTNTKFVCLFALQWLSKFSI